MISAIYDSPIGPLTLASNGKALIQVEFEGGKYPLPQYELGDDKILDQARRELDQYFAGKLTTFKVKVDPQGTEFQRKAWAALQTIPYGETRSYAQQAKAIGSPKATRAIGAANGQTAEVTAIDVRRGTITVAMGSRSATLPAAGMQHLDHAYAQTAHRLQGQTADRALLHLEDWRLNLTNQRSFYVLLSRAKDGITIATSNRTGLIAAIRERTGEQQAALDQLEIRLAPAMARDAMQRTRDDHMRQPGANVLQRARTAELDGERATNRERERDDDLSY